MDNENIITWNVPNWITISLMAAVGFMVLGFLIHLVTRGKASRGGPTALKSTAAGTGLPGSP